ncbi:hypothetical protein G9A89_000277 [Geosiphon pyriformis]|nr:hypothetical protein G9A89_000277 [Geosiphon pyriformis]
MGTGDPYSMVLLCGEIRATFLSTAHRLDTLHYGIWLYFSMGPWWAPMGTIVLEGPSWPTRLMGSPCAYLGDLGSPPLNLDRQYGTTSGLRAKWIQIPYCSGSVIGLSGFGGLYGSQALFGQHPLMKASGPILSVIHDRYDYYLPSLLRLEAPYTGDCWIEHLTNTPPPNPTSWDMALVLLGYLVSITSYGIWALHMAPVLGSHYILGIGILWWDMGTTLWYMRYRRVLGYHTYSRLRSSGYGVSIRLGIWDTTKWLNFGYPCGFCLGLTSLCNMVYPPLFLVVLGGTSGWGLGFCIFVEFVPPTLWLLRISCLGSLGYMVGYLVLFGSIGVGSIEGSFGSPGLWDPLGDTFVSSGLLYGYMVDPLGGSFGVHEGRYEIDGSSRIPWVSGTMRSIRAMSILWAAKGGSTRLDWILWIHFVDGLNGDPLDTLVSIWLNRLKGTIWLDGLWGSYRVMGRMGGSIGVRGTIWLLGGYMGTLGTQWLLGDPLVILWGWMALEGGIYRERVVLSGFNLGSLRFDGIDGYKGYEGYLVYLRSIRGSFGYLCLSTGLMGWMLQMGILWDPLGQRAKYGIYGTMRIPWVHEGPFCKGLHGRGVDGSIRDLLGEWSMVDIWYPLWDIWDIGIYGDGSSGDGEIWLLGLDGDIWGWCNHLVGSMDRGDAQWGIYWRIGYLGSSRGGISSMRRDGWIPWGTFCSIGDPFGIGISEIPCWILGYFGYSMVEMVGHGTLLGSLWSMRAQSGTMELDGIDGRDEAIEDKWGWIPGGSSIRSSRILYGLLVGSLLVTIRSMRAKVLNMESSRGLWGYTGVDILDPLWGWMGYRGIPLYGWLYGDPSELDGDYGSYLVDGILLIYGERWLYFAQYGDPLRILLITMVDGWGLSGYFGSFGAKWADGGSSYTLGPLWDPLGTQWWLYIRSTLLDGGIYWGPIGLWDYEIHWALWMDPLVILWERGILWILWGRLDGWVVMGSAGLWDIGYFGYIRLSFCLCKHLNPLYGSLTYLLPLSGILAYGIPLWGVGEGIFGFEIDPQPLYPCALVWYGLLKVDPGSNGDGIILILSLDLLLLDWVCTHGVVIGALLCASNVCAYKSIFGYHNHSCYSCSGILLDPQMLVDPARGRRPPTPSETLVNGVLPGGKGNPGPWALSSIQAWVLWPHFSRDLLTPGVADQCSILRDDPWQAYLLRVDSKPYWIYLHTNSSPYPGVYYLISEWPPRKNGLLEAGYTSLSPSKAGRPLEPFLSVSDFEDIGIPNSSIRAKSSLATLYEQITTKSSPKGVYAYSSTIPSLVEMPGTACHWTRRAQGVWRMILVAPIGALESTLPPTSPLTLLPAVRLGRSYPTIGTTGPIPLILPQKEVIITPPYEYWWYLADMWSQGRLAIPFLNIRGSRVPDKLAITGHWGRYPVSPANPTEANNNSTNTRSGPGKVSFSVSPPSADWSSRGGDRYSTVGADSKYGGIWVYGDTSPSGNLVLYSGIWYWALWVSQSSGILGIEIGDLGTFWDHQLMVATGSIFVYHTTYGYTLCGSILGYMGIATHDTPLIGSHCQILGMEIGDLGTFWDHQLMVATGSIFVYHTTYGYTLCGSILGYMGIATHDTPLIGSHCQILGMGRPTLWDMGTLFDLGSRDPILWTLLGRLGTGRLWTTQYGDRVETYGLHFGIGSTVGSTLGTLGILFDPLGLHWVGIFGGSLMGLWFWDYFGLFGSTTLWANRVFGYIGVGTYILLWLLLHPNRARLGIFGWYLRCRNWASFVVPLMVGILWVYR